MCPDELHIIERYFRPLAGEGAFNLLDDAATLKPPANADLVITTDMIAEAVHFLPNDPPATIAQKVLRVNLSDLAAKGATPMGYVLSIALSHAIEGEWLESFAEGLGSDGKRFGISLLGGDTISTAGRTVISVTALGVVPQGRMVRRAGAKPGDGVYISGEIGAAAAGLALLQRRAGPWDALAGPEKEALIGRYRIPQPRVELGQALVDFASAAMDISDGLVGDCDKLARVSGCRAELEGERAPIPAALRGACDAELFAALLTAGDDYEILAAIPPAHERGFQDAAAKAGIAVTRIGTFREGQGVTEVRFQGGPLPLQRRAYEHGRQP